MPETLLTLAEVLDRFKGLIGKTRLVAHIKAVPRFNGGPTHRKNGAKYLFTDGDIERVIASLECQDQPALISSNRRLAAPELIPTTRADRAYADALALLTKEKPNSDGKGSMLRPRRNSGSNR